MLTALLSGLVIHAHNARLPGTPPFLSAQLRPSTGLDFISLVLHIWLLVRDLVACQGPRRHLGSSSPIVLPLLS